MWNCPACLCEKKQKKTKTHKHSRDSQKINTFPCGTADWLIGAVRNRSHTKQPLYQWYTGKKQPEACVNPTAGDSSGTGSHQKRSPDRFQIPGPEVGFGWCKERFMVFFIIQWMSVKDLFNGWLIIGGGGNWSVLTLREWTSASYRCPKWTW